MPTPNALLAVWNGARGPYRHLGLSAAFRCAYFCACALWATWPFLTTAGALNDFRDAHMLVQYEAAARRTLLEFGQLPAWNPWYCGGLDMLGTPQSQFASPTFLLTLLFGTHRAEPVIAFVMLLVGLEGAFRYFRSRGAPWLGAVLAAPVFGLSGVFAGAPMLGWTYFYGFELLPWALFGARLAARGNLRGAVVLALATAWLIGTGGTYAVPFAALGCMAEFVEPLFRHRFKFRWAEAAVAASLAVSLGAFRFWPVLETITRTPRLIGGTSANTLASLATQAFGAPVAWYLVGAFAVPAALAGLGRRRSLSLALLLACCIWLATGYSGSFSLFGALRHLPVYSALRYPERFLILGALFFAALAARGADFLFALGRRRPWARALTALVAVGLGVNLVPLVKNFHAAARERTLVSPPEEVHQDFHQARGNRWAAAYFGPMSRGSLSCMEGYPVRQSPLLRGDLESEAYLDDPSAGTVREEAWSPNRLAFAVDLARPERLLINQNYHTAWRSTVGAVVDADGLLAVDLPAGQHTLVLRFLSRAAWGGLAVSLVAAAACVLVWRRAGRKRDLGLLAIAIAPWVVGLSAWKLIPEADSPPAHALGSSRGQPLVADALPEGARRLGVVFEGGVELQGVRTTFEHLEGDDSLVVEFDWKVTGALRRDLGFFVHIEPEGDKRFNADHALISNSLALTDAPEGKTLRDFVRLGIASKHRSQRWTVYVGLWAVHSDGSRMKVLDAKGTRIHEDRAQVATVDVACLFAEPARADGGTDSKAPPPESCLGP